MLNKIASFYLLALLIISLINLQQRLVDSASFNENQLEILNPTESSFLLITNSINKHQVSNNKHKNHKKKLSNHRNRAAVHKTSTSTSTSTTATLPIENSNENESNDFEIDLKRHTIQQQQQPEHVNVTVKVGDTIILNCAINSSYGLAPGVIWMQGKLGNVLTLDTSRITADTRFEILRQPIQHSSLPTNELALNNGSNSNKRGVNYHYQGGVGTAGRHHNYRQTSNSQNSEFNYYHLKINNVQIDDENEYACETSMSKQSEEQSNLHALFNLHVTQSPGFIEQLTSETNNALFENSDTVLKCFAAGKPVPKIRWYQLTENNEILQDLYHESTTFSIKNVTRNDPSKYECVASNGILPSVSKKFQLTVYFSPSVIALNQYVYQTIGQSVLLGCLVSSNPESTVVWYRKNNNKSQLNDSNNNDFELIDVNDAKYQVNKFKQTNQTVHYFKIKYLENSDYSVYKCEATNLVNKNEAVIEILDLEESEQYDKNIRKSSISYVLNNPYLDEYNKIDEIESENEEDEFKSKNDLKQKMNSNNSNKKKQQQQISLNVRKNSNRTFQKYQINKSNSIQDAAENSLQRLNDIENSSTSSKQISFHSKLSFLILSSYLIYNLIF